MDLFDLVLAGGGRKGSRAEAGPAGKKDRHAGAAR